MPKYAVITNDLQYGIAYKNEARTKAVNAYLPDMVNFLDVVRENGVPVIHLQLIIPEDDPRSNPDVDYVPLHHGAPEAKILEECLGDSDVIMEKNKDSGFFETELHSTLKEMNVETIIITGMQTQICVQTTAADGFFRGYNVIVPPEGVVSAQKEDKDRALEWLESYCARIMSTSEIVKAIEAEERLLVDVIPIP